MDVKSYDYYHSVSLRESDILASLRLQMKNHPMGDFQISPEQGQFMSFLVRLTNCSRYLEIGTFTGYSTLAVAQAMSSNGEVITCDKNREWTDIAKQYWKKVEVEKKISLRVGEAKETLDTLLHQEKKENYFDIAFIDADKINHDMYYEYCLQLIRQGGVILVDNVFRHGKVLDEQKDEVTQAVHDLNQKIHKDSRVDMCMLPISDGLTIVQKK
ncbi:MAG: O-methyltransferase [Minisyncoccota bacterium]